MEGMKVRGSLGCSDKKWRSSGSCEEGAELKAGLGFRRADFGRILWITALEGRGFQDCWLVFKYHLLQAPEWSVLMSSKSNRRPAWMYEGFLTEKVTQVEYRHTEHTGVVLLKPKHLWSWREHKGQQEQLLQVHSSKRKTRENVGLLLSGTGDLVTKGNTDLSSLSRSLGRW